ncbi:hypothetical protein QWZ10_22645 [Paracoccus cavernae]|uniref:Uncharacterized protein n=1 Tax=Paracoccus cavernae TaxID=1571207 RepID=A0ABT8DAN0_9RHOB|nr:hypothetical protein [Paracoccus cavernae]
MIRGKSLSERVGRLAGGVTIACGLGLMLVPLVLVFWLSVISNEILSCRSRAIRSSGSPRRFASPSS